jgi:hypothetical protein
VKLKRIMGGGTICEGDFADILIAMNGAPPWHITFHQRIGDELLHVEHLVVDHKGYPISFLTRQPLIQQTD